MKAIATGPGQVQRNRGARLHHGGREGVPAGRQSCAELTRGPHLGFCSSLSSFQSWGAHACGQALPLVAGPMLLCPPGQAGLQFPLWVMERRRSSGESTQLEPLRCCLAMNAPACSSCRLRGMVMISPSGLAFDWLLAGSLFPGGVCVGEGTQ